MLVEKIGKAGKWHQEIDTGVRMYRCSVCNCRMIANQYDRAVGTSGYRFCPYCGSKNRGEEDREGDVLPKKILS